MYKKRGQAALEFLMTYGWAILSAIIVIGALGTYFVVSTGGSDKIIVNEPFGGVASQVNSTHVILEIKNKAALDYTSVSVNVSGGACTETSIADMASGDVVVATIPCSAIGTGSFKGTISIKFLNPESTVTQRATGQVSGPIL